MSEQNISTHQLTSDLVWLRQAVRKLREQKCQQAYKLQSICKDLPLRPEEIKNHQTSCIGWPVLDVPLKMPKQSEVGARGCSTSGSFWVSFKICLGTNHGGS